MAIPRKASMGWPLARIRPKAVPDSVCSAACACGSAMPSVCREKSAPDTEAGLSFLLRFTCLARPPAPSRRSPARRTPEAAGEDEGKAWAVHLHDRAIPASDPTEVVRAVQASASPAKRPIGGNDPVRDATPA